MGQESSKTELNESQQTNNFIKDIQHTINEYAANEECLMYHSRPECVNSCRYWLSNAIFENQNRFGIFKNFKGNYVYVPIQKIRWDFSYFNFFGQELISVVHTLDVNNTQEIYEICDSKECVPITHHNKGLTIERICNILSNPNSTIEQVVYFAPEYIIKQLNFIGFCNVHQEIIRPFYRSYTKFGNTVMKLYNFNLH